MTDSFVCEPEGLTTSYEQNPNLEQYRLNDSDWSLLVDMNAYLEILRRFTIEVDVESCESSSRLFSAWKNLEGQLSLFRKRKPHMKPIGSGLHGNAYLDEYWSSIFPVIHMMGDKSIDMQTKAEANFVNSP